MSDYNDKEVNDSDNYYNVNNDNNFNNSDRMYNNDEQIVIENENTNVNENENENDNDEIVMECKKCKAQINNKGTILQDSGRCKHSFQPVTKIVYLSALETIARDRLKRHQNETSEFIKLFDTYKKKLDENKSNCLTHLRNTVDELKNLLDQRQKALTIQLVHTYDLKKEAVNKQYDALVKT